MTMQTGAESEREEVWTQLLRLDDLKLSAARRPESGPSAHQLAWADDGFWPLSDEQMRLLSFEALILCHAPPVEADQTATEDDAADTPSNASSEAPPPGLSAMSEGQEQQLAQELALRLARSVVASAHAEEEERLPKVLKGTPRPPAETAPTASEHFDHEALPSAKSMTAVQNAIVDGDEWQQEEPLELKLQRLAPTVATAFSASLVDATVWLSKLAERGAEGIAKLEARLSGKPEPPSASRQRSAARRLRAKMTDAIVEEVRLYLGIPRDLAGRMARLLHLPPPAPGWHTLPVPSTAAPAAAPAVVEVPTIFADIQSYVPYRLLLLLQLRPPHFASHHEFCQFGERQLAAFVCGLLGGVRSAGDDAVWEVTVGISQRREALSSEQLEAVVLLLSREQLLPLLQAPADAFDEARLVEALRKLSNLAWVIYAALPARLPHVDEPEQKLPFLYPAGLGMYARLVGVSLGAAGGQPLPVVVAAEFDARLQRLRRSSLLLSDHAHLLCVLQRSFSSWIEAMRTSAIDDDAKLTLARKLRATARQLLQLLRAKHTSDGPHWHVAERRDHREILPSVLRFLHALLTDYHSAFNGEVDVPLSVLRESAEAYFDLLSVARSFPLASGLTAEMCTLSDDMLRRQQEEAEEAALHAADHAAALEAKVHQIEDRVADGGAAAAAVDEFLERGAEWALQQAHVRAHLETTRLLTDPAADPSSPPAKQPYSEADAAAFQQRQSDALNRVGRRANEEFDPKRAFDFFSAAHALAPRTPILLSAANMLFKMGDCGEAGELYRRILARPASNEHRAMAQRKLREAEADIASNREALAHVREKLRAAKARVATAARSGALASPQSPPRSPGSRIRRGSEPSPPLPLDAELREAHAEHARQLVLSSSEARFARLLESFAPPIGPLAVSELLRELLADLKVEQEYFGPALARQTVDVYRLALQRRAELLLRAAAPALAALADRSTNASNASERLDAFEQWGSAWPMLSELQQLLADAGLPPLALRAARGGDAAVSDVAEAMSPLVTEWVSHLTTRFDSELDAAWQRETWDPIDDAASGSYHAAVVWDLFKLFMSTLEVFFGEFDRMRDETGLPPPVRPEWVNDLAFRMFIILNKFLNTMRQDLGSWELMRPAPVPYAELEPRPTGGTALLKSTVQFLESFVTSEKASVAAATETVMALCVRLNSLSFCVEQLGSLSRYLDAHWAGLQEELRGRGRKPLPPLQRMLHEEAPLAVRATIDELCTYIGAKVVFVDLREPILDQLYLRSSAVDDAMGGELAPMLHTQRKSRLLVQLLLDDVLICVSAELKDARIRRNVIFSVFTATVEAIEHALLDGGAARAFRPEDSLRILADVEILREYFVAKDEKGMPHGLPESLVHGRTARLEGLVRLMRTPSLELLPTFINTVSPAPDYDATELRNKYNIGRILLHRARLETDAMQFVESNSVALAGVISRVVGPRGPPLDRPHGRQINSDELAQAEAEKAAWARRSAPAPGALARGGAGRAGGRAEGGTEAGVAAGGGADGGDHSQGEWQGGAVESRGRSGRTGGGARGGGARGGGGAAQDETQAAAGMELPPIKSMASFEGSSEGAFELPPTPRLADAPADEPADELRVSDRQTLSRPSNRVPPAAPLPPPTLTAAAPSAAAPSASSAGATCGGFAGGAAAAETQLSTPVRPRPPPGVRVGARAAAPPEEASPGPFSC